MTWLVRDLTVRYGSQVALSHVDVTLDPRTAALQALLAGGPRIAPRIAVQVVDAFK